MTFNSAKYDYCLKALFENKVIREGFISDVLGIPAGDIKSTRLANSFLNRRYRKDKLCILDILVVLNNDTKINIEMQVASQKHWDKRSLYYLSRMYSDDLKIGEHYERLKRCVSISILDFNVSDRPQCHNVYRLRDADGHEFSDLFEIHTIELRKDPGDSTLADWVRLFNAESEEDMDMIGTGNAGVMEAIKEIKIMNLGKRLRWNYEMNKKAIRDRNARDDFVRDEGIEIGANQKLHDQVKAKLAKGKSIEQMADELEETPEKIREVVAEIEAEDQLAQAV